MTETEICVESTCDTNERERGKNMARLTLTCFSVLVQLESRRAPAVEASDGVTAESLAPSVCLLALVHI